MEVRDIQLCENPKKGENLSKYIVTYKKGEESFVADCKDLQSAKIFIEYLEGNRKSDRCLAIFTGKHNSLSVCMDAYYEGEIAYEWQD